MPVVEEGLVVQLDGQVDTALEDDLGKDVDEELSVAGRPRDKIGNVDYNM